MDVEERMKGKERPKNGGWMWYINDIIYIII